MLQRLAPLAALALLPLVAPFARKAPVDPIVIGPIDLERDIATFVPEDAILYLEGNGLVPVLEQGLNHPFVRNALDSEFAQALLADATMSPEDALAIADAMFGSAVLPAIGALATHGLALGVTPNGADTTFVLVLRGSDAELLGRSLASAFDIIEDKLGMPGILDRPQSRVLGADVWNLGEDFVVATRDTLLVASNDKDAAREVLELAAEAGARGITAHVEFRSLARERVGGESLWGWADLVQLSRADPENYSDLGQLAGKPDTQALLGPGICAIGTSKAVSAWITLGETDVEVGLRGVGAEGPAVLSPTPPDMGSDAGNARIYARAPDLSDERDVANALLYRDYASFFRERVALFPPETLPGFSEPLTIFSLFFGGKDFGEDVLPHISPWLRFISRDLEFEDGRTPENRLPGLAVVTQLEDPERSGVEWITAFQTLIGILNADQAQKQGTMMQLRLGLEGTTEITSARFHMPGPDDGVDMRYNLQPACAVVGDSLILGSHEHIVRSIVRQLVSDEGSDAHVPDHPIETLSLSGAAVGAALKDNLDTLVMQKVLDDGVSYEEAQGEIGGLVLLANSIESLSAAIDYGSTSSESRGDTITARIRLTLRSVSK